MCEGQGYDFWRRTLKGARLTVAPMVDASELAWRLLSRRYGAELCYTPMLHSHVFVKDVRYRRENLASCAEDRPLIVQFCANDPDTFVEACRLAAPHCDAVDLNLGCPQAIARKGHYGAFLQDEWDLVNTMIHRATTEVDLPVTAKIRVFDDLGRTVEYARMLEQAGVSLLTVHGRTRAQKGPLTGLASWHHIKAVKEAVSIPVLANGNIQYLADVRRCMLSTGAEGVMSAEGNLYNPALYSGTHPLVWQVALEYLELVIEYPCPPSYTRGHLFKLLHHCLCMPENFDIRHRLSKTSTTVEMVSVIKMLKERMEPYHTGDQPWNPEPNSDQASLPFPPWLCQPYVRISPEQHLKKVQESQKQALEKALLQKEQENEQDGLEKEDSDSSKRPMVEEGETDLSKKKKKKMVRNPKKSFTPPGDQYDKCACKNPKGGRCVYGLCRACCRSKCYTLALDCPGHRILVKTKREKAAIFYGKQKELQEQKKVDQGQDDTQEGQEKIQEGQEATQMGQEKTQEGQEHAEQGQENTTQEDLKGKTQGVMGQEEKFKRQEQERQGQEDQDNQGQEDWKRQTKIQENQAGMKSKTPDSETGQEEVLRRKGPDGGKPWMENKKPDTIPNNIKTNQSASDLDDEKCVRGSSLPSQLANGVQGDTQEHTEGHRSNQSGIET